MSRAFMKEREDVPEAVVLTDRVGPAPITAAGFVALEAQLQAATDPHERARLERLLDAAIVVAPPDDPGVVAFGATVRVEGASPKPQPFTIVGDIEADPVAGKIGLTSPLAAALIGAHVGDAVIWHRPAGDRRIVVRAISYDRPG
jgi:transcription elongation factor GreB